MPETAAASPLAPMPPDDALSAFNYIYAVEAGDVDAACEVAAGEAG